MPNDEEARMTVHWRAKRHIGDVIRYFVITSIRHSDFVILVTWRFSQTGLAASI